MPQHVKSSGIIRSRNGCLRCRKKKRKCDEAKPSCSRCLRLGHICPGYTPQFIFRDLTKPTERRCQPQVPASPDTISPDRQEQESGNGDTDGPLLSQRLASSASSLPTASGPFTVGAGVADLVIPIDTNSGYAGPVPASGELVDNGPLFSFGAASPLLDLSPAFWMGNDTFDGLLELDASCDSQPSLNNSTDNDGVVATPKSLENLRSSMDGLVWGGDHARSLRQGPDNDNAPSVSPPSLLSRQSPQSLLRLDYDISLPDRPYLAHFIIHILGTLPSSLRGVLHDLLGCSAVQHAVLALSVCNLNRLRGTPLFTTAHPDSFKSSGHYRLAIESAQQGDLDPESLVATMVFMAYYELDVGTIHDTYTRLSILESLLLAHEASLISSDCGRALLQATIPIRARISMSYCFSPFSEESPHRAKLQSLYYRVCGVREELHMIVSQVVHINFRLLLISCLRLGYEDTETALTNTVSWYTIMRQGVVPHEKDNPGFPPMDEEASIQLLSQLQARLENLRLLFLSDPLAQSAPCNPSTARDNRTCGSSPEPKMLGITPLFFSTHEQAMDEALYAFAQLFCDRDDLRQLCRKPRSYSATTMHDDLAFILNPWLSRLFAVAAGLDPAACVFKNTYNLGIICMLTAALVRVPNPTLISYVLEEYLPRMMAVGPSSEDACSPLSLYSAMLKILRRETVQNKRRVLLIGSQFDQMTEKSAIFAETGSFSLLVHGLNADGSVFNETVTAPA